MVVPELLEVTISPRQLFVIQIQALRCNSAKPQLTEVLVYVVRAYVIFPPSVGIACLSLVFDATVVVVPRIVHVFWFYSITYSITLLVLFLP